MKYHCCASLSSAVRLRQKAARLASLAQKSSERQRVANSDMRGPNEFFHMRGPVFTGINLATFPCNYILEFCPANYLGVTPLLIS